MQSYTAGVLGDYVPYAQSVIGQENVSQHSRVTQLDIFLNASHMAVTQQAQGDRGSWNTFANSSVVRDDVLVIAIAKAEKARAVVASVQQFADLAALAPGDFESPAGQYHAVLIWDGVGFHRAGDLQVPSNVTLISLPPYSPELNPLENLWRYLRSHF